jgi:hypothetical protein
MSLEENVSFKVNKYNKHNFQLKVFQINILYYSSYLGNETNKYLNLKLQKNETIKKSFVQLKFG